MGASWATRTPRARVERMFRFAHLAFRDLVHYWGRTTLAMVGIGVVVAVFLTLAGLAEGLGTIAGQVGSGRNILLLDPRTVFLDDASIAPEVAEEAARVPGVTRAVPMLYRHVRMGDTTVHLRAVPLDSYREALGPTLVSGRWLGAPGSLMVGEGLAKLQGWSPGDTLEVAGEAMTVVGVLEAEGFRNSEMWVSLREGQRLLGRPDSYSVVLAQISPEADAESVQTALAASLPDVRVLFEQSVFQQVNQAMSQVRGVILMVSALALAAIVFGVFNVASMTAAEKRREVAILKAIGVSRRHITEIFLLEGLVLAVGGLALGLAVGTTVVAWLSASSAVNLADVPVQLALKTRVVIFGAGATLLMGLLGAVLPARRAAAVSVVEALRE